MSFKLLIRSAKIIDSNSPFHTKTKDILIINGKIEKIADSIPSKKDYQILEIESMYVSPGWMDMYTFIGDPGFEYKEDISTATKAATAGGFTGITCLPNTNPPLHSKSQIEYILKKSANNIVDVYPVGAITVDLKGKEMTEMLDMYYAGAIAFSDGDKAVADTGVMMRSLQYAKHVNSVVFSHTEDIFLMNESGVNEGVVSTEMGCKGIPAIAEELMVMRDIQLAEYTESKVHLSHISTKKSVEIIKKAKAKGIQVTAGVTPYHLIYNENEMLDFDSNFKVNPPLRTKEDVKALQKAVIEGTIDVICSNHKPQDDDAKKVEFEYASYGMINLQTVFSLLVTNLQKEIPLNIIIEKLSTNPRKIIGIKNPIIQENELANITIFTPQQEWIFSEDKILSKSKNSPFVDKKFKGKVIGIVNNGKFEILK